MKRKDNVDEHTWRVVRRIQKNIKRLRKQRGWTQEEMENHGFGARWYQRFESGRYIPTIPTLDKLARAFKVDIQDIFK